MENLKSRLEADIKNWQEKVTRLSLMAIEDITDATNHHGEITTWFEEEGLETLGAAVLASIVTNYIPQWMPTEAVEKVIYNWNVKCLQHVA